ncbi:homeobox protein GBX [Sarotherodon galilaeus]
MSLTDKHKVKRQRLDRICEGTSQTSLKSYKVACTSLEIYFITIASFKLGVENKAVIAFGSAD